MLKAAIIGAGRIGTGFNWNDDAYTHAGAYRYHRSRVRLAGIVEKDVERRSDASVKWAAPASERLDWLLDLQPDIVSICTGPKERVEVLDFLRGKPWLKGVWCEKPWKGRKLDVPTQVNYLRRADKKHQHIASLSKTHQPKLIVYGKPDETTMCHFYDLAHWWNAVLDYRDYNGPCAYVVQYPGMGPDFFDNGGINPGECMNGMLGNLLDHVEKKTPLYSPV